MTDNISPNTESAAPDSNAVPSLDSIASKMALMREQTAQSIALRNREDATKQTETGQEESAETSSPVAPDEPVPEVVESNDNTIDDLDLESDSPEEVTTESTDSTSDELIDFLEFADSNPNAKFKFMRNGKEITIDAKKAASILGQGAAISEDARQLKIERAEFDEYQKDVRSRQEGLTLAMEFTVQPKLQSAYDEIVKTQGYQTTFQQQLQRTSDPAQIARIQAGMSQNEQYIRQQQQIIGQLKPQVDEFRKIRRDQIKERIETTRKSFEDKDLKNEFVFNELRDKLTKVWPLAGAEIIPGVPNLDLITSDEKLLGLIRDGLKYRDKPTSKPAGSSMAVLTQRRASTTHRGSNGDDISKLREQAKAGDKKAGDNLLVAQLQRIRASRGGR
jgi:ribosomal protein S16